jgi:FtsH-binding integral membrane protein
MSNRSAATSPVTKSDTYFDALKKHLPAGLLATYLAADGMLAGIPSPGAQLGMSWVVFVLCLAACPLWMYFYEENKNAVQITFACVSFVILVLSMGGPLNQTLDNPDHIATSKVVAAVAATFFTGLVAPLVTKATAAA